MSMRTGEGGGLEFDIELRILGAVRCSVVQWDM